MYLASRRGDYLGSRRGDPGLFGFLGRLAGGAARTVGGLLPGPAGSIARYVGSKLAPQRPPPTSISAPMPSTTFTGIRAGGPLGISAGVEKYQGYRGSVDVPVSAPTAGCPKGYRPNKSGYYTRDGQYHPPGTKCVRYRYRNVANGRALKRAISRTAAFDRMVKQNRKALRALSRI